MPLRHLVVTPLPNGRSGNTGFLSVHLSPRLREKGVLSDYADFGDWGQFTLAGPPLQFQVLANGKPLPPAAVSVVSPPVDPAVWQAVFGDPPDDVPVEPFTFVDRSNIDVNAIDSGELSEALMALVRAIAALGGSATRADVAAAAGGLFGLLPAAQQFLEPIGNGADPPPPSPEFHDQLGLLNGHPFLMRVLGLVYDLEVTLPGAAVNEVAVRTNWPAKAGALVSDRDQVPMRVGVDLGFKAVVDQTEFRTIDWLALDGPKYAVAQLDLINAIAQAAHLQDDLAAAPSAASPVEVPALLESGISIIHGDLGDVLRGRLERQRAVENGIDEFLTGGANLPPRLFAEDITLGYRYDVEDLTTPGFHSLHDRQARSAYVFPRDKDLELEPPPDEGWGSIALMTDGSEVTPPQATTVRYDVEVGPDIKKSEARDQTAWRIDDHLMTWGGWSLSTPRPGNSTTGAGEVGPRKRGLPAAGHPIQFQVDYVHVNGTLPKLRYGRSYKLRARCVDLAGNGPVLADTAPPEGESPVVQYGRLTPLSSPLVIRRESRPDPGVGDLSNVLVIKSELEDKPADIETTDRLLFPPRVSQGRLERHDLPRGGNAPGAYAQLAERDALSIEDQTIEDPETGELVAGTAVGEDGQVVAGPTRPDVGYIADPVAGAAAFIGLPGADPAGPPVLVGYGTWPNVEAVDVELRAGSGPPVVAAAAKRVRVRLPKGTVVSAEVSHAPEPSRLEHMALAQDLDDPTDTLNGLNLSISGRSPLTFVHAVRVPLRPPRFTEMSFDRDTVGQTDVGIDGTLLLHRATTDHVVLRARWVDTIDGPGTSSPADQVNRRFLTDLHLGLDGAADHEELEELRVDLGDTKRRVVTVAGEAFCRFSRYFTERLDFAVDVSGTQLLDARGVAPGTVVLSDRETGLVFSRGAHYEVDRLTGVLTVTDGLAIPAGASVRAEFIPLPISRLSTEARRNKVFRFDVPSSAAPPPPSVLAVLPAFDRQVTASDDEITVHHDGRVLRLHLDRPWFASGAGELLGVAVDSASVVEPVLTRWGRDPLVAEGGEVDARVTVEDFASATEQASAVDGRFDVAAYEPVFDPDRKFWVADVRVDANVGYRPFVVLNVCRYQPLALTDQHLSTTVELEPLRLGAERDVTVRRLGGSGEVEVELVGADDDNVVTAILQEADPAIEDPDLRWRDVSSVGLVRTGATALATHSGVVSLAGATADGRRLLIEDGERATVEENGTRTAATVVSYREIIEIPADW